MMWLICPVFAADATPVDSVEVGVEGEVEVEGSGPDRSRAPDVEAPIPLDLDGLTRHELGPGIDAWHVRIPRIRKVTVEVIWWSGRVDLSETYDARQSVFGSAWGESTEKYDSSALSEQLDVLDMELWAYIGDHRAEAGMTLPLDDLGSGLDILEDVVFHPTFPKKDLKLQMEQTRRFYETQGPSSPQRVAGSALGYAWNAADHPYGYRPDLAAMGAVKSKDALAVHQSVLDSGPVSLMVVGDLAWEDVESQLKKRFGALGAAAERSEVLDAPMPDATRVIAVAMPDAEQVTLRLRMAAPSRHDARYPAMAAAGYALGGHFLSRLNKNLREDKGWTYGVGAWYGAGEKRGSFNVSVDVPAARFAETVGEIEKEIGLVAKEGVTDAEIDAWWRAEVMEFNTVRGTIDDAVGFYDTLLDREEDIPDERARLEAADQMTVARSSEVAAELLGEDAPRVWVVVGPKDAVEEGLGTLGWEAEWITPSDAVLGKLKGGP